MDWWPTALPPVAIPNPEDTMPSRKLLGAILLTLGLLALIYGGFTYTKDTHSVDLGFIELEAKDRERVTLPPVIGVVSIVVGALLLGGKKR
jgi:uncharacterized membrane protein YidH (DUF202 family)